MDNGTRRNRRQFRRDSACFAEEKDLGIPLRTNSQKRKTLGIPSLTIFGGEKPRNSVPNNFFSEEKNFGILFLTNSRNRKHSKIHSKLFLGTENTRKKTTFVSCFVKLHYFAEFHSDPFRSEVRNGLFLDTRNDTDEHFIPRNNKNRSEAIPRNFIGTKFRWQPFY